MRLKAGNFPSAANVRPAYSLPGKSKKHSTADASRNLKSAVSTGRFTFSPEASTSSYPNLNINSTITALDRAAADLTTPIRKQPQPRQAFLATASWPYPLPNEESFADKLCNAVKARIAPPRGATQKEHAEMVEREKARYRKPVRRQRSKGE